MIDKSFLFITFSFLSIIINFSILFYFYINKVKTRLANMFEWLLTYIVFISFFPLALFIKDNNMILDLYRKYNMIIFSFSGIFIFYFIYSLTERKKDAVYYIHIFSFVFFYILINFLELSELKVFKLLIEDYMNYSYFLVILFLLGFLSPYVLAMKMFFDIYRTRELRIKIQLRYIFVGIFILLIVITFIGAGFKCCKCSDCTFILSLTGIISCLFFIAVKKHNFFNIDHNYIIANFFDENNNGILALDSNNNIVNFNKSIGRLMKFDKKTVGVSIYNLFPDFIKNLEKKEFKFLFQDEFGNNRCFLVDVMNIDFHEYDAGKMLTFTDITEKYMEEIKLKEFIENQKMSFKINEDKISELLSNITENEKRYKSIFDNKIDGVCIVDLDDLSIESMNISAQKLFDIKIKENKKIYIFELFKDLNTKDKLLEFLLKNRFEILYNKMYLRKYETEDFFMCGISIYKMIQENNSKIVFDFKDLSEIIQKENALILTERVRAMSSIIGGVTHEFNNIHTVINGFVTMADLKFDLNPELKSIVKKIKKSGERASSITENLMFLCRESNMGMVNIKIKDIVNNSVNIVRNILNKNNIDIEVDYFENPEIKCFSEKIGQVFYNILNNFIYVLKDNEDKKIKVTVYAIKDFVVVEFYNNGPSIPSSELANIFIPFYSLEKNEHLGLGLSISEKIVFDHNGKIEVVSDNKIKTVFKIYLPVI